MHIILHTPGILFVKCSNKQNFFFFYYSFVYVDAFIFVQIMDPSQVYDAINTGRLLDMQWPKEEWRANGGRAGWGPWMPRAGMEGTVVHRWTPNHKDALRRSPVDGKTILRKIS